MAFRKSGIALNTRVLDREAASRFVPDGHPPMNPEVGDMWEGRVWDGGAWVSPEVFDRSQAPRR
jgi:hypothetical protein